MRVKDERQVHGSSADRSSADRRDDMSGSTAAKTQAVAYAPQRPARDHGANPGIGLLTEGSRFGAYLIGTCIGQGGMARVYRAEHEGLQRQVALKVLLDGQGKASDGHERFLREARIAAAIKHPNVVNIFDVGVHQGTPYLVMELLEGVDLDAFVEAKTRLDEATIMDIVVPIAGALAAVHDAGIVHRDLKPGNIFLARGRNDEIEPRLLDFGISKSTGPDQMRLTSARGQVLGTPFYMSPEAARGAEMTPLSDQYALGLVLYECATGVNPFTPAGSFVELVQRVTTGDFQPVSSHNAVLSKRMVAIIERAMQLDPARRFPDMRAMGRELLMLAGQRTRITWGLSFNELAAAGALAKLPSHGKSKAPQSSRRARYVGIAALAMAALIGGAYTATQRQRNGDFGATARVVTAPESRAEDTRRTPHGEPRTARVSPAELAADEQFAHAPANPVPPAPELAAAEAMNVGSESAAPDQAASRPVSQIALAVGQALRKPRRSQARVTRARRSTEAAPTLTTAAAPEWIAGGSASVAAEGGDHGTNNAPIFD